MVSARLQGEGGAISGTTNASCAAASNAAAFHRLRPLAGHRGASEDAGGGTAGAGEGGRRKSRKRFSQEPMRERSAFQNTFLHRVGLCFPAAGALSSQQSTLGASSHELGKPACLSMSVSNMSPLGVCIISDFRLGADTALYTGEKVCRSSHDPDLMCQGCSSPSCPHYSLTVRNTSSAEPVMNGSRSTLHGNVIKILSRFQCFIRN